MKSHKEKIDELITLKRENNLLNHISTSFFNKGETIAEKNLNEYVIWRRNYWVGTFYPIFRIRFNENDEIKSIKSELSLNGKLWVLIISGLILSFFLFALLIPIFEDFEYLDYTDLIMLTVYGLLVVCFYLVLRNFYKNETKYLANELKIAIGIESKENIERIENGKKEWTLKSTLIRLIFYPISIAIILFTVNSMFQGNYLRGDALFGILLPIGYLYADIRILRKKRIANDGNGTK